MSTQLGKRDRRVSTAAIFFTALVSAQLAPARVHAAAPTCAECTQEAANLVAAVAQQKTQQDLLGRNRAYLAAIKSEDLSKAVKVRSNILILTVRIETTKNNMESSRLILTSKECKACPGAKK